MNADKANDSPRFAGVARLYGSSAFQRFSDAHICVVGVGGVGSWAAEALARSGIGKITLIDGDCVAESNTNRQIHALAPHFGRPKTSAMAERICAIHPACQVCEIREFITPETVNDVFGAGFDFVIDAIDQVRVKAALIACCHRRSQPLITSGGAGGKTDPAKIRIDDLAKSFQDPLLARLRSLLRKNHGFPGDSKRTFGIPAVFSSEQLSCTESTESGQTAGFGTAICVTASFGLFAAGEVLRQLACPAALPTIAQRTPDEERTCPQ